MKDGVVHHSVCFTKSLILICFGIDTYSRFISMDESFLLEHRAVLRSM